MKHSTIFAACFSRIFVLPFAKEKSFMEKIPTTAIPDVICKCKREISLAILQKKNKLRRKC